MDVPSVVGITLMVLGSLLVLTGALLCYLTKGEYYNEDEVQAMVAAEILEEERKKQYDMEYAENVMREEMEESATTGTWKKTRAPLVAS